MTTVTTLASRRAAPTPSQATTATSRCPDADLMQLHMLAVTALHGALRFLTHPDIEANKASLNQALSRAMRATSALKRACSAVEG